MRYAECTGTGGEVEYKLRMPNTITLRAIRDIEEDNDLTYSANAAEFFAELQKGA